MKTNLAQLMGVKGAKERRILSIRKVAQESGVNHTTLSEMAKGNIAGIRSETAVKLCTYFGCQLGELFYIEYDNEPRAS